MSKKKLRRPKGKPFGNPVFFICQKTASFDKLLDMKFVVATSEYDVNEIVDVINAAYSRVKYLLKDRVSVEDITEFLRDPDKTLYLCLTLQDEICGTILLDYCEGKIAEIGLFAIHSDFKGQNIGPAFIQFVEGEAFKKVDTIQLKVIPLHQENLIKFYERLGYKATGETTPFPTDKLHYIRPEYRDQVFLSLMQKNNRLHILFDPP